MIKPCTVASLLCDTNAACENVRLTPDDNKIIVFINGKAHGFIGTIPSGGQTAPIQIEGDADKWKNAQKKAKKNIISDTMKSWKPKRNDLYTCIVWWLNDSITMSWNQKASEYKNKAMGIAT